MTLQPLRTLFQRLVSPAPSAPEKHTTSIFIRYDRPRIYTNAKPISEVQHVATRISGIKGRDQFQIEHRITHHKPHGPITLIEGYGEGTLTRARMIEVMRDLELGLQHRYDSNIDIYGLTSDAHYLSPNRSYPKGPRQAAA